jgi:hypothetical protein
MQEFPATDIAVALGLSPADRTSFDYAQTLALKEKLVDICKRCTIRYGLPDQARKHVGDAIGLPDEPVLRYPHREIPMDPRWEALANAIRFPAPGDFPLATLEVLNAQSLKAISDALPSLLEDIDFKPHSHHGASHRPLFAPISRDVGDALADKINQLKSYGADDPSAEGDNRAIGRNAYRQMRIYLAVGPEWTLVSPVERLALVSQTLPSRGSPSLSGRQSSPTTTEPAPHASRRNFTGVKPAVPPSPVLGLTWAWIRHEGRYLPPAWGGPQNSPWGRWEPQFPDTDKPNTSLFGHSSVYIQIDLDNQRFRDRETKKLLESLLEIKTQFEESRRAARREGAYSGRLETILTSRLIKKQDEALDALLTKRSRA